MQSHILGTTIFSAATLSMWLGRNNSKKVVANWDTPAPGHNSLGIRPQFAFDNVGPNLPEGVGGWGQEIGAALSEARAAPILSALMVSRGANFANQRGCDR